MSFPLRMLAVWTLKLKLKDGRKRKKTNRNKIEKKSCLFGNVTNHHKHVNKTVILRKQVQKKIGMTPRILLDHRG